MNLKKIGPVVAILAIVLVIAIVVIANWTTWLSALGDFAGEQVGLDGLGTAVIGDATGRDGAQGNGNGGGAQVP